MPQVWLDVLLKICFDGAVGMERRTVAPRASLLFLIFSWAWSTEHIKFGNQVMDTAEIQEFISAGGLTALMVLAGEFLQSNPPEGVVKDPGQHEDSMCILGGLFLKIDVRISCGRLVSSCIKL